MADPASESGNEWTIGKLLSWTRGHFESKGVDEPRLSAELLLAKAMGLKRIDLYARFEQRPTNDQRAQFREMVIAAAAHQPIAYLIGTKEFYSLDFIVTPDVLIPRPETELLVERVLAWCKEHSQPRYDLLDIGTGSGCIAVTLAKKQPAIHAVATDISEPALEIARENARRHGVERVRFVQADLLELPEDAVPQGGFDIIDSNTPYVSETETPTLPENVRKYEPSVALFAGQDGLEVFRLLARDVKRFLKPGGLLAVEVGMGQADAVIALFVSEGGLRPLGRFKDGGGIERTLEFTLPA
jgi:release factor glutamine methyltransferase